MYTYQAKLKKVVDGDTFDMTVDLGFRVLKVVRVRLANYDAPEVRGAERIQGLLIKELCKSIFKAAEEQESIITLESQKTGKYGRWIGDIRINSRLIQDIVADNYKTINK